MALEADVSDMGYSAIPESVGARIAAIPSIGEMVGQGSFSPNLLAQAMAIAIILGAVGGIYPAWRATKMQPVKALRYE